MCRSTVASRIRSASGHVFVLMTNPLVGHVRCCSQDHVLSHVIDHVLDHVIGHVIGSCDSYQGHVLGHVPGHVRACVHVLD